ncbi:MAG: hypothetical protein KAS32_03485 [Candidatus Peribacteraceae bacterium]|nr:hypothetical protein [Candidatus Peribacteraceae bacterium]
MDEYIKTKTTIRERILFLFTGLIKKGHIVNPVVPDVTSAKQERVKPWPEPKQEARCEELDFTVEIPFFEFDESEAKSNL